MICGNCGSKNYNSHEGYCRECFCAPLDHVWFEETNNFNKFNDYIDLRSEPNASHSKIYRLNKIIDETSKKNGITFNWSFYKDINTYLLSFCEFFFSIKSRKNFPSYQQIINYFAKHHGYQEYAQYFKKCETWKIRVANHQLLREFDKYLETR